MMTDEKKPDKKKAKKSVKENADSKETPEETLSNGLPEDIDFKKFLGCGG